MIPYSDSNHGQRIAWDLKEYLGSLLKKKVSKSFLIIKSKIYSSLVLMRVRYVVMYHIYIGCYLYVPYISKGSENGHNSFYLISGILNSTDYLVLNA